MFIGQEKLDREREASSEGAGGRAQQKGWLQARWAW